MKFEIKLPAIAGDTVPLFLIADAMARHDATAGGTDFHEPAYKGRLARYESMLLRLVRTGQLPTCDDDGDAGEPAAIVQQRAARGAVQVLLEVAATPAKKGRAKAPVSSSRQSPDGLAVDDDQTWLFNLFVKLKVLNEWASGRGDEFAVAHDGNSWIDERGVVTPGATQTGPAAGRDHSVQAPPSQSPAPAVAVPERARVSVVCTWTLKKPTRNDGLAWPLFAALKVAHDAGLQRPTAREVVDTWEREQPAELFKVMPHAVEFYTAQGETQTTGLEAIRRRIERMTASQPDD